MQLWGCSISPFDFISPDLSLNSMLVFTAWTPDGRPYGGSSMHLFDDSGTLKMGKQKLIFYFDRRAENHVCSATAGELYER
jgi:hypothetical protein